MPDDFAGSSLGTARAFNITPTTQTFADYVDAIDRRDFYSFTTSASSSFNLTLNGLSANANVRLLNSSGQVLQSSTNLGTTAESINTTLNAGTYYILVNPANLSASTYYNLNVSANIPPQELQFNMSQSTYNFGDRITLEDAWVYDGNGYTDLARVDLWLQKDGGTWQDLSDTTSFEAWASDQRWASFQYELSNLNPGNYILWGQAYDQSGSVSNEYQTTFTVNQVNTTEIRGTKWNDLNGNGVQEAGEPGLAGWTIYLDQNLNGQLDTGETSTTTDASGNYAFTGLAAGTYTVAEIPQSGWTRTLPSNNAGMQSTLIPVADHRDLIFDPGRDLLYITTSDGDVERYDVNSRTLLTPFDVGNSLNGGDITPDGNFLYIAEGQRGATQAFIRKVNLNDGVVTNLTFNLTYDDIPSDVAIGPNGIGLIRSFGQWHQVRQLNLNTDAITTRSDGGTVYGGAQITRSADRSLFFMTQDGISSGPLFTYDTITNTFSDEVWTNAYLGSNLSAVNRDGSLIALEWGSGISVMDSNLNAVENLINVDGGLAFDPLRDILYAVNSTSDQVIVFNTNTWNELYRLNIGEDIQNNYDNQSRPFGNGMMSVSDDGQYLFLSTASGVRMLSSTRPGTYSVNVSLGQVVDNIDFGSQAGSVTSTTIA